MVRSREQCHFCLAQAYMLISMPTCTSAIFGVFQAMIVSSRNDRPMPVAGTSLRSEEPLLH